VHAQASKRKRGRRGSGRRKVMEADRVGPRWLEKLYGITLGFHMDP